MAIGLAALGLKSLFGGKKPPTKEQVQKMKPPVQEETKTPTPDKTPVGPTKVPKVTTYKASSPLFKKTGIVPIDKSLQNISQSLGNIKSTLTTTTKFNKEKREIAKNVRVKNQRRRSEAKRELKVPFLAGIGSFIKGKARAGFDPIMNFLMMVAVGSIATFLLKNIQKIIDFVVKVRDKIKEVVGLIDKNILQPAWKLAKAVIGPIYEAMKKIGVVPDFDKEENEIGKYLNDLALEIPILGDLSRDIQEQVRKMKFDLDVTEKDIKQAQEQRRNPSPIQRPSYQGGTGPSQTPPSTPSADRAPRGTTGTQPSSVEAPGAIQTPDKTNEIVGGMGFELSDWNVYRNTVAQIESGGRYDIAGGSGGHYDGRYQLGADAKTDAAKYLGVPDPGHGPAAREKYRKDPTMQENYFAAFTLANHTYLMGVPEYANASPQRKLQILGYAHNQGMGNAEKWMKTGVVGRDGFGTKGTKYTDALRQAFTERQQQVKPPIERPPMVSPQTPIMGEAYRTGLRTASSRFIGGSSDYHIDTKFPADLPVEQAVAMVDQMSLAYGKQGREIEFSNAAVSGLVYDHNASYSEKLALLRRVFGAHAPRGGWRSMDYYIPLKSDSKGRFGQSAEGAEIVTPTIPGGSIEYHEGGKYGSFVVVVDANGKVISKTGHGDIRDSKAGTIIRIPNSQSTGVDRNTTYERRSSTTIITPPPRPTQTHGGGASGMMSGPGGGGSTRALGSQAYIRSGLSNKLYKNA